MLPTPDRTSSAFLDGHSCDSSLRIVVHAVRAQPLALFTVPVGIYRAPRAGPYPCSCSVGLPTCPPATARPASWLWNPAVHCVGRRARTRYHARAPRRGKLARGEPWGVLGMGTVGHVRRSRHHARVCTSPNGGCGRLQSCNDVLSISTLSGWRPAEPREPSLSRRRRRWCHTWRPRVKTAHPEGPLCHALSKPLDPCPPGNLVRCPLTLVHLQSGLRRARECGQCKRPCRGSSPGIWPSPHLHVGKEWEQLRSFSRSVLMWWPKEN